MELFLIGVLIMIAFAFLVITLRERSNRRSQRKFNEQRQKGLDEISIYEDITLTENLRIALDHYKAQGIRIPLDIVLELQYTDFENMYDAVVTIENRRHNWKLENSKKVGM